MSVQKQYLLNVADVEGMRIAGITKTQSLILSFSI